MILIQISEITINPGRRAALPEDVRVLADSIAEQGLLCPITVDKNYTLIAGLHRLEAAKLLSWTEIECTISELEGLQAEMAEIDENYIRINLTPLQSSKTLHRRKEIYEALHPETKAGAAQGFGMKCSAGKGEDDLADKMSARSKSFAKDTADTLGIDERTVRRQVEIAEDLTKEAQDIIEEFEESGAKVTQQNLLKLAHLESGQQAEAAEQLVSGRIKSVDDYVPAQGNNKSALPFQMTRRTFASVEEGVADLKNMDKDCSSTPGDFLAEVTAFVQKFQQEIEWFNNPYYEEVFPDLNDEQREYLRQQMDTVSSAAKKLYKSVERKSKK